MPLLPVPFRGGLDLMSPATSVAPGTLKDCLNYERGNREGYTRIDGFRRVDGNSLFGGYQIVSITGVPSSPIQFSYPAGTEVEFFVSPGATIGSGYLLNDAVPGADATLYVVMPTGGDFDRPFSSFIFM